MQSYYKSHNYFLLVQKIDRASKFCLHNLVFNMSHQFYIAQICRTCFSNVSGHRNKYKLSNMRILELIQEHYKEAPKITEEDETKFPKWLCQDCYKKLSRHCNALSSYKKKCQRYGPNRHCPPLEYKGVIINFPTEAFTPFCNLN